MTVIVEVQKEQHALTPVISVPEGYASVENQTLVLQPMSIPAVTMQQPADLAHVEDNHLVLAKLIHALQVSGPSLYSGYTSRIYYSKKAIVYAINY